MVPVTTNQKIPMEHLGDLGISPIGLSFSASPGWTKELFQAQISHKVRQLQLAKTSGKNAGI